MIDPPYALNLSCDKCDKEALVRLERVKSRKTKTRWLCPNHAHEEIDYVETKEREKEYSTTDFTLRIN